jgi:hypothetical protein
MITSMMDMFTIILIFLLFQFSENPEKLQLRGDLELPESTARAEHVENCRLVLTLDGLHLDNELIARVEKDRIIGLSPDRPEESELYKRLYIKRAALNAQEDQAPVKNHILLLCDRRHSFKTINCITKTAAMAGFPNFQFGVLKK